MAVWVQLTSSNQGKRASNDDFVAVRTYRTPIRPVTNRGRTPLSQAAVTPIYKSRKARETGGNRKESARAGARRLAHIPHVQITALVACDGVGSRPNSSVCARAVGEAALRRVRLHLQHRPPGNVLSPRDAEQLKQQLQTLTLNHVSPTSATTFVMILFDHRRTRSGYNLIVLWAGDSRIHLLDMAGQTQQLTTDHHDEDGRLTAYFSGDGRVLGTLDTRHYVVEGSPLAICATTDGVHEHCQPQELCEFLLYCVQHQVRGEEQFSAWLSGFLNENISDNYSAALLYHRFANGQ